MSLGIYWQEKKKLFTSPVRKYFKLNKWVIEVVHGKEEWGESKTKLGPTK